MDLILSAESDRYARSVEKVPLGPPLTRRALSRPAASPGGRGKSLHSQGQRERSAFLEILRQIVSRWGAGSPCRAAPHPLGQALGSPR